MALCPSQSRVARRVPGCFLLPCTFSEVNGTLANCLSQKLMPCVGRMAIARRLTSCSSASLMRPALLDVRILCCARSTGIGVEPLQLSRHGLDPALTWKMAPTCGDACFFNLNSPAWSLTEDPPYVPTWRASPTWLANTPLRDCWPPPPCAQPRSPNLTLHSALLPERCMVFVSRIASCHEGLPGTGSWPAETWTSYLARIKSKPRRSPRSSGPYRCITWRTLAKAGTLVQPHTRRAASFLQAIFLFVAFAGHVLDGHRTSDKGGPTLTSHGSALLTKLRCCALTTWEPALVPPATQAK